MGQADGCAVGDVLSHRRAGTRHPPNWYEAFLEGIVLFIILQWYDGKNPPRTAVSACSCWLYGVFRFLVEFVRLPDAHIGYLAVSAG